MSDEPFTSQIKLDKTDLRWTFTISGTNPAAVEEILLGLSELQQTDVPTVVFRLRCSTHDTSSQTLDREQVERGQTMCDMIERAGKFTICVIEQDTYADPFEIALACHLRIGLPDITVGFPEAPQGKLPRWGGLSRMTRMLGETKTLQFLALSPVVDESEARVMGFLHEVHPLEHVAGILDKVCLSISRFEPVSRALLIRNLGIGEEAQNLNRFEAFLDHSRLSPYRPSFSYTETPSADIRTEDSRRNYSVIFDHDLEGKLHRGFDVDQVDFLFRQFIDAIDFEIRGRVIELGAGSCWFSSKLSRLKGVSEVVALELSDNELIVKGTPGLERFGADMDKIQFIVGNFNSVSYAPESFDVVVFARALHHSNDAKASLTQANRLLRPGGKLIAFQEHIVPAILSRTRKLSLKKRTTVELTLRGYKDLFAKTGFDFQEIPYFVDHYRDFRGLTFNDRYLVQYTPRRLLNRLFYGYFHLVGTKVK